jgi:hypothetical protein
MVEMPLSRESYWPFIIIAAERYEVEGKWPHLDDLIYQLAANERVVDLGVPYRIPRQFGYVNNDGELELSALGLIESETAPRSVKLLLNLVKICVQLALEFRRSAKLNSLIVAETFVGDEFAMVRGLELVSKLPGLVGGGHGGIQDDEWDRDITVSALAYKEIETLDDLRAYLSRRANPNDSSNLASSTAVGSAQMDFEETFAGSELIDGQQADPRNVFVVYGRDSEATGALWTFLEAIDLHPMSWEELVHSTGMATPYTGDVVAKAFEQVQAVIVLLTPDDEARLHESLRKDDDPVHERSFTGQPRPNVFFEAGMAFGRQPHRTIIVEIGTLRPASDLLGRNTVRMGSTEGPLEALAKRLESAGCPVNRAHPAWLDTDRFTQLAAHLRKSTEEPEIDKQFPRGTKLSKEAPRLETRITARLISQSRNEYLLEVANRGNTNVVGLKWSLPDDAKNWAIRVHELPQYPIPELRHGDYIRLPTIVMRPGPSMTDLRITAVTSDGLHYETLARLSIYG